MTAVAAELAALDVEHAPLRALSALLTACTATERERYREQHPYSINPTAPIPTVALRDVADALVALASTLGRLYDAVSAPDTTATSTVSPLTLPRTAWRWVLNTAQQRVAPGR